jgi:pimeloyl-ACP methyl ester carboxylesterase
MHEKQFYGRGPGGFHRIAYVEWGQASAQPPVICVHGLARNGRDFDYCNAPHSFVGLASKYFVRKEGV